MTYLLQITEANHTENQFFTLGGAGFDTEAERQANLATIPAHDHDCAANDRCYMLDILDPEDEFSVVNEFEISEATAHTLLGVEDFEPIRVRERAMWDAASAVTS
jgi:hypothetical protein